MQLGPRVACRSQPAAPQPLYRPPPAPADSTPVLPTHLYCRYLYFKLQGNQAFSLRTLVTSIAVSFANLVKNILDIYVAYKVLQL